MIRKGSIVMAALAITAIMAVAMKPDAPAVEVADYGSLSVTLDEPTNSVSPALRSIGSPDAPYRAGMVLEWPAVKIHNELNVPTQWDIKFIDTFKTSHYWIPNEWVRMGDDILCEPPPDGIEKWIVVHERLPVAVGAKETKEVLITLEIPEGIELPAIWELRLHYENLSQQGNVLCAYDQIWQIYSL